MDKQYLIRDDHIGLFKNFMPNELIDDYLNYFNNCEKQGIVFPRKADETFISDHAINTVMDAPHIPMTYNNKPFIDLFFKEAYPFICSKIFLSKKISYSQHTRS